MDVAYKRGFMLARDPNAYMERSERRGNYRPRRRRKPPILYAIITIIMLLVLYPVGLVLLWRRKLNWSHAVKAVLSLIFAAVFALGCMFAYSLDSVRPYADNLFSQVRQVFNPNDDGSQGSGGIVTATGAPTDAPSDEPTDEPTDAPTAEPTDEPTAEPTEQPTDEPTAEPTDEPTATPTKAPTAAPTATPTAKPTQTPTAIPTAAPTFDVSARRVWPIVDESEDSILADIYRVLEAREYPMQPAPTDEPTAEPTSEPTDEPTAEPTSEPTAEPTATPTVAPTKAPTQAPTKAPTAVPTQAPTKAPTAVPTQAPTKAPTAAPTQAPTTYVQPTIRPTATAHVTEQPTAIPTSQPTTVPTATPITTPETVYHTATGTRFHLTPNCGLTSGASPDTWAHAVESGFKPCPDCVGKQYPEAVAAIQNGTYVPEATFVPAPTFVPDPTATPDADVHPETVYHTATGSRFHLTPNCGQTRGASADTWDHSVASGYRPCQDCVGKEYPEAYAEAYEEVTGMVAVLPTATFVPYTPAPTTESETTDLPEAEPTFVPAATDSLPTFVYHEQGGTYYHSSADCSLLKSGSVETAQQAYENGESPCPECNPQTLSQLLGEEAADPTVYTGGGKYYHKASVCGGMLDGQPIKRSEAIANGQTECPYCHPDATPAPTTTYSPEDAVTVYYAGGKYYHKSSVCGNMQNGEAMPRGQAIAAGALECPYCHPDATATPVPTETPTPAPTEVPTPAPTDEPTPESTDQPTPEPSAIPTAAPTEAAATGDEPTAIPTIEPVATAESTAEPAPTPYYDPDNGLQFEQEYVYMSSEGEHYHGSATCTYDGDAQLVRVQRAVAVGLGLTACPGCQPDADLDLPYAIVYQCEGDTYFHTSETCSKLGLDSTLMLLSDAVIAGRLPCPECVTAMPTSMPTLAPGVDQAGVVRWVYRTVSGAYYHSRATCSGIYSPYLVTLQDAEDAGLTPCPICEQDDAASGEN